MIIYNMTVFQNKEVTLNKQIKGTLVIKIEI